MERQVEGILRGKGEEEEEEEVLVEVGSTGLWVGNLACLGGGRREGQGWGGVVCVVERRREQGRGGGDGRRRLGERVHASLFSSALGVGEVIEVDGDGNGGGKRGALAEDGLPKAVRAYQRYRHAFSTSCSIPPFLIACPTGKTYSVAFATALLLAHFDCSEPDLPFLPSFLPPPPEKEGEEGYGGGVCPPLRLPPLPSKEALRQPLVALQRYHPHAFPSRRLMKEVWTLFNH